MLLMVVVVLLLLRLSLRLMLLPIDEPAPGCVPVDSLHLLPKEERRAL